MFRNFGYWLMLESSIDNFQWRNCEDLEAGETPGFTYMDVSLPSNLHEANINEVFQDLMNQVSGGVPKPLPKPIPKPKKLSDTEPTGRMQKGGRTTTVPSPPTQGSMSPDNWIQYSLNNCCCHPDDDGCTCGGEYMFAHPAWCCDKEGHGKVTTFINGSEGVTMRTRCVEAARRYATTMQTWESAVNQMENAIIELT